MRKSISSKMFSSFKSRPGNLLMRYEKAVRAYMAAVHTLTVSRGAEFKKATLEAERLHEECEVARDALCRARRPRFENPS